VLTNAPFAGILPFAEEGYRGSVEGCVTDYVTVDRADNEAIAHLIRQRLDQGGIPCVLVPSDIAVVAGAAASYAVTVPAERADEARALLRD
jgi:hypothetical protein